MLDDEMVAERQRSAPSDSEPDSEPDHPDTVGEKPSQEESKPSEKQSNQDDKSSKDEDGDADEKREQDKRDGQRKRSRPWVLLIGIVLVVIAVIGGLWWYFSTRNLLSTDDAYTDGRAVMVAPRVSGDVVGLLVNDNEFVRQGQTLVQIDPRNYREAVREAEGNLAVVKAQLASSRYAAEIAHVNFPARLEQAQAQLEQAKANLYQAQTDYRRQHSLPAGATTQQAVDHANATFASAKAQVAIAEAQVREATPVPQNIGQATSDVTRLQGLVEQAQAKLANAKLQLSWCTVRAPHDGWIAKRGVERGNYVQPGQALLSLVQPEVWITANFRETDLNRMRPGQVVHINVDAYPGLKLIGHVSGIEMGSGSKFSAFPPENATGNFVKIVQRVPVKILIDSGLDPNIPLPLGLSAEPTVHLK